MDGFNDTFDNNTEVEADPAAEFLAREQSNLAGLEDDLPPVVQNGTTNGNGTEAEEKDTAFLSTENEIDSGFEMISHNSYDQANVNNGFGTNDNDVSPTPSPAVYSQIEREEPEKIKRWREDQKKRLEEKDEEEEKRKAELKVAAKKELDDWYKTHEEQVAKNRSANRSAEKELVADTEPMEPGTEWERIAKLCDFNPKTSKHSKDISRMRSIILQVKQNPPIKRN